MLWLTPFPWARWAATVLVVVGSLWLELRPSGTEPIPFAVAPITPGQLIDGSVVNYVEVPIGILEPADTGTVAMRTIEPGDPVLASSVGDENDPTPDDWWVVTVTLPTGSDPGDPVRLVLLDQGTEVEGVVTSTGDDDPFGSPEGAVAVPPEQSADVAAAAAAGRLVVLVSAK